MDNALEAVIVAWSPADSVGRLRLATGEELRFGASACSFLPNLGLNVLVLRAEPHPLGGRRASALALAQPEQADDLLDQAAPLPALNARPEDVGAFAELTDGVGLFGVVLREPLTTRARLRAWLERGGASVDFSNARAVSVRVGGLPLRVFPCMTALAGGQGAVSFAAGGPFSVHREREQALAGAMLEGKRVNALADLAPLWELVRACAASEGGVIVHQAGGALVPAQEWLALGQLEAFTRVLRTKQGDLVLHGMSALYLPDLFVPQDQSPEAEALARSAARSLVELGKTPRVGERLGAAVAASSDAEWVRLARATS